MSPNKTNSQPSTSVYHALLTPQRIEALSDCDKNLLTYDPFSFLLVFRLRGRHFEMICLPLLLLLVWDIFWGIYLIELEDPGDMSDTIQGMAALITPILTPVSFLLVFRLGRAAVRYWEARAAMGKVIEVCRTVASTALIGCGQTSLLQYSTSSSSSSLDEQQKRRQQQQQAIAEDFVRWIAAFPMAVKNFLRPFEGLDCNRTSEVGKLLSVDDRLRFINTKGENQYAPILVLNQLRQLAFQASFSMAATSTDAPEQQRQVHSQPDIGAMLFRQLNEQIDLLTGAWGALERINGTPLPFVYVVHLRTFLLLYLFLWHMEAIASSGWISLLPLQLASWGLLGIEAAAVCCERPFQWNSNHLALGKACIVVSRNLAQTMENVGWMDISAASEMPELQKTP